VTYGRLRLTGELGLGRQARPGMPAAMLRPGLLAGIGFGGRVPGWAAADLRVELHRGGRIAKLDLTLGLKPSPRLVTMVQIQAERGDVPASVHLAPAAVWHLRKGLSLTLGARIGLSGSRQRELRLGSWIVF
jgi:hypothetical protein